MIASADRTASADVGDPQARLLGERPALGSRLEADDDVDPRLVQVEGVGVALAAVADDRDRLARERGRVGIVVVVHLRRHRFVASSIDCVPRVITMVPVRTSSLMPKPRSRAMSESTSAFGAGRLDDERPVGDVHDPALVHLDDLDDLRPVGVGRPDLHERQLVLDRGLGGQVLDLEHVDEPVELLGGLLDRDVVTAERDRHPADVGVVGVAHRQRLDVEVAGPHEAGDPVEDAGPVVHDGHEDVATQLAAAGQGPGRRRMGGGAGRVAHSSAPPHFSMRSDRPLPAGIIGKTFCSSAISNQMRAGPSTAWAALIASSTSSGRRRPERRHAERVGELGEVRAHERRRVVVAGVDDLLPLADHAELLVVEQGDLHRDVVLDEGHQLLERHLEPAVAGDRPGLALGGAEGRAHRRRDAEAHRPEPARRDVLVREPEAGVAGEPHLVLADVGDVGRLVLGQLADPVDDVVGRQEAVAPGARAVPAAPLGLAPPLGQLREVGRPAGRVDRVDHRRQGPQDAPRVADDGHLHGHVLADLGRVDVDVDDPRVGRVRAHVAGHPVVEAHARARSAGRRSGSPG